jgi:hypothetical protein
MLPFGSSARTSRLRQKRTLFVAAGCKSLIFDLPPTILAIHSTFFSGCSTACLSLSVTACLSLSLVICLSSAAATAVIAPLTTA